MVLLLTGSATHKVAESKLVFSEVIKAWSQQARQREREMSENCKIEKEFAVNGVPWGRVQSGG